MTSRAQIGMSEAVPIVVEKGLTPEGQRQAAFVQAFWNLHEAHRAQPHQVRGQHALCNPQIVAGHVSVPGCSLYRRARSLGLCP